MTHARESLFIMDGATTTFGKQKRVSMPRNFLLFVVLFFLACLVATGLLVYHFAAHAGSANKNNKTAEVITCLNYPHAEETTEIAPEANVTLTEVYLLSTTEESVVNSGTLDLRLPTSVVPDSYELKIIPFIYEGNFTFKGEVVIVVNVTEATSNVTLHVNELSVDVDSVEVLSVANAEFGNVSEIVGVSDVTNDTKRQFLIIHLEEELSTKKQYSLYIKYEGTITDGLQGFYRSSYRVGNQTK